MDGENPALASRESFARLAGTTVTFVFTDIEASTQLQTRLRDQYAAAVADHRELVRRAFAGRGGLEVDTQGDSFFYAFPRAIDALLGSAGAQRALESHPWPAGEQLRVRMGLHSGEPTLGREGFVGLSVVRAARIMGVAHGGQILVSQATYSLIRDDLPDGFGARELGTHRLKDLSTPERIYQITVPGLRSAFPPLRVEARLQRRRRALLAAGTAALVAAIAAMLALAARDAAPTVPPNSLGVVDPAEARVVETTLVGSQPTGLSHARGTFWTANFADGTVTRVDAATRRARTIPLGTPEEAHPRAVVATGADVWVALAQERELRKIDARFGRSMGLPIPLSTEPVAITAADGLVCAAATETVECFDAEGIRRVKVSPDMGAMALAWDGQLLWVGGAAGVVSVDLRTEKLSAPISLPGRVTALMAADGWLWAAYAAGAGSSQGRTSGVSRIRTSTRTETRRVGLGARPSSLAHLGRALWVTTMDDETLSRLDAETLETLERIELGSTPTAVVTARGRVWVVTQ